MDFISRDDEREHWQAKVADRDRLIADLQLALDTALVGGNSIASALVGLIEGGPTKYKTIEEASKITEGEYIITGVEVYEQWLCWHSMVKARKLAENALIGYEGTILFN
jgi:hypothetical protein